MFTGIISDIGRIDAVRQLDAGRALRIATAYDPAGIDIGASIACAGVCLTVTALPGEGANEGWFEVEAWEEALRLTTAGSWAEGQRINLERALRLGDELGGHLVSGHVDGMAEIIDVADEGEATRFRIRVPQQLKRFIAVKGSVCLDGTSLTVNGVADDTFDVLLIRHSLEVTTWGQRQKGDRINLEVDQIARYAERLFGAGATSRAA